MAIDDILSAAEDTQFALLGKAATYTPAGGEAASITVIPVQPDQVPEYQTTRVQVETTLFHVRVSEVAAPVAGGSIVYGGTSYTIKGKPRREDPRRRIWTIETVPA